MYSALYKIYDDDDRVTVHGAWAETAIAMEMLNGPHADITSHVGTVLKMVETYTRLPHMRGYISTVKAMDQAFKPSLG